MDNWNQLPRNTKIILSVLIGMLVVLITLVIMRWSKTPGRPYNVFSFLNHFEDNIFIPTPAPGLPAITASKDSGLYNNPRLDSLEIGVLKSGHSAELVGLSDDQLWWAIKIGENSEILVWVQIGYVNASNSEDVPIVGENYVLPNIRDSTVLPTRPWLIANENAEILAGPGDFYGNIGILEAGQGVEIIGRSEDGSWWVIHMPYSATGKGWILASKVETMNSEIVPVEETPVQGEVQVGLASLRAIANVNIRVGPDLKYKKIGVLKEGESADVLGVDPEGFWWAIKFESDESDSGRGWVSKDYVITSNTQSVPEIGTQRIAQDIEIPTPAAAQAAVKALANVNIRSGPGTQFGVIARLDQGKRAEVVGISEDGLWWVIRVIGGEIEQGWVAADFVSAENTTSVPVIR